MSRYSSIVGFPYAAGIGPYNFDKFEPNPNTQTTMNENNPLSPDNISINFKVETHGIKTDFDLYWSTEVVSGTLNSSHFSDGTLTGTFNVDSLGVATISRTLVEDQVTNPIAKSFKIVIRLGNPITGGIMIKSPIITINDTSLTPLTAYSGPRTSSVGADVVAVVNVSFNTQTIARVTGGLGSDYDFTQDPLNDDLDTVGFPAGFAFLAGTPTVASMTPITYTITASQTPQIPYQYAAPDSVSFTLAVASTLTSAYKDVASAGVTRWLPPNREITPFIPVQGTGGWIGYPAGTKPLQYAYTMSSMPGTVTLSPTTGEVSGTTSGATSALTFNVTVQDWATDPQITAGKQFTMRVATVLTSTTALTNLIIVRNTSVAAFRPIRVTGNTAPISFSMPTVNGLSMNSTGQISGTPTSVLASNDYIVTIEDVCQPVQRITPTFKMGFCEVLTASSATDRYVPINRAITPYIPVQPTGGHAPVTQTITTPALRGTLALNPTTWTLSGTAPSTVDPSIVTYTVRTIDSSTGTGVSPVTQSVNNTFRLQVVPVLVGTVAFPKRVFIVNNPVSYTPITVNTTTPTRTFAVRTGAGLNPLPTGFNPINSSTGLVSGTPTVAQTAPQSLITITLTIQDTCSPTQSLTTNNTFQIGVAPLLVVSRVNSIVYIRTGIATSFQAATVNGGWTPTGYPLTVTTSRTLLGTLTINTSGLISGTAGAVDSFPFTVTASESSTDVNPPQSKTSLAITLNTVSALTITTLIPTVRLAIGTSLGAGILPIQVTGGSPIKSYLTSTLPAGLNPINSTTGVITGTPTGPVSAPANRNFIISDECVPIATNTRLVAFEIVSVMNLSVTNPPNLFEGVAVTAFTPVTATGGATTKTFEMDATTPLPAGMAINSATGQITGTPTNSGKILNGEYKVNVSDNCAVPQRKQATFIMNILGTSQRVFDTPGNYTFVVPAGVTSISAVTVGGGGGGARGVYQYSNQFNDPMESAGGAGGGGALAYRNNISVTPGQTIYVTVGAGGAAGGSGNGFSGGNSFVSTSSASQTSAAVIAGGGAGGFWANTTILLSGSNQNASTVTFPWSGKGGAGGTVIAGSGGAGGAGGNGFQGYISYTPNPQLLGGLLQSAFGSSGGGGAGGYTGVGGYGGPTNRWKQWSGINATVENYSDAGFLPAAGAGGGGGGAGPRDAGVGPGGTGGGVGVKGLGANGAAGSTSTSLNNDGGVGSTYTGIAAGGYGGGGGGGHSGGIIFANSAGAAGRLGAVRIMWPGNTRAYPSTGVADTWY
jgi:hypothetical protein